MFLAVLRTHSHYFLISFFVEKKMFNVSPLRGLTKICEPVCCCLGEVRKNRDKRTGNGMNEYYFAFVNGKKNGKGGSGAVMVRILKGR